jgi:hypothetical protein
MRQNQRVQSHLDTSQTHKLTNQLVADVWLRGIGGLGGMTHVLSAVEVLERKACSSRVARRQHEAQAGRYSFVYRMAGLTQ